MTWPLASRRACSRSPLRTAGTLWRSGSGRQPLAPRPSRCAAPEHPSRRLAVLGLPLEVSHQGQARRTAPADGCNARPPCRFNCVDTLVTPAKNVFAHYQRLHFRIRAHRILPTLSYQQLDCFSPK
eukprot:15468971-Alexandrium_andersonii.AAC.1